MDYALENMREEDKGLQLKPKIQQIFWIIFCRHYRK